MVASERVCSAVDGDGGGGGESANRPVLERLLAHAAVNRRLLNKAEGRTDLRLSSDPLTGAEKPASLWDKGGSTVSWIPAPSDLLSLVASVLNSASQSKVCEGLSARGEEALAASYPAVAAAWSLDSSCWRLCGEPSDTEVSLYLWTTGAAGTQAGWVVLGLRPAVLHLR